MFLFDDDTLRRARNRLKPGQPYFNRGTEALGYLNAPADGANLLANAAAFMSLPLWAGAGKAAQLHASIWTGYPSGTPDTEGQYPTLHLFQAKSAAFLYALDAKTYKAQGQKVAGLIRRQYALSLQKDAASRTTFLPNWDGLAAEQRIRVSLDSGTQEAAWLTRLLFCYDCVQPLFAVKEKTDLRVWLLAQARWLADREAQTPYHISALYPGWLKGDFSRKGYLAAPTCKDPWAAASPQNEREAPYASAKDTGGRLYTHRRADGRLGHPLAKAHLQAGHNRFSIRMQAVLYAGALLGDAGLYEMGKSACKLFLVNNTFADGTTAEWARNGDYRIPAEGALGYQAHNTQLILLACQCGERLADGELPTWSTREGCHGTEVAPGLPPKTFDRILDRLLDITTDRIGAEAVYHGTVSPEYRLSEWIPARTYKGQAKRAEFMPHLRTAFFWAHRFWPKPDYLRAAQGRLPGQKPLPVGDKTLGFRNNGPIPTAFEGAFAEFTGLHLLFA